MYVGTKIKPVPKPKPAPKVEVKKEVTRSTTSRNVVKASNNAAKKTVKQQETKAPVKQEAKAPVQKKEVAQAPVKKQEAPKQEAQNNSSPQGKVLTMNASAYDLSYASTGKNPGDKGYGITASGMKAGPGVVAVDPRVIPLGTKLYIEGYGNAIAGDTGGAIKGNRIDLFFSSNSEAMNFGRRTVKVTILK